MRGLFNRFANFMQGRYGTDKLNNALWVLLLILWFVNIFVWNRVARYIIELDDSSHEQPDRKERDIFVDNVLTACGYKVLHTKEIKEEEIEQFLKG